MDVKGAVEYIDHEMARTRVGRLNRAAQLGKALQAGRILADRVAELEAVIETKDHVAAKALQSADLELSKRDIRIVSLERQVKRLEDSEKEAEARVAELAGPKCPTCGVCPVVLTEKVAELCQERNEARTRVAKLEADRAVAASNVGVPIPEPETDLARALAANSDLVWSLRQERARVAELEAVIDKHIVAEGPCNEEFVDDTHTPYCSDRDCTYCELAHSTDKSSLAHLYHEQRERKGE